MGDARLEKFLSAGFGIPASQFVLADEFIREDLKDSEFRCVKFDMLENWPNFDEKFDFIFFPESFGVAHTDTSSEQEKHPSMNTFNKLISICHRVINGETLEAEDSDFLKEWSDYNRPGEAREMIKTINKALEFLNEGGEIRIQGHTTNLWELAFIVAALRESPAIKVRLLPSMAKHGFKGEHAFIVEKRAG